MIKYLAYETLYFSVTMNNLYFIIFKIPRKKVILPIGSGGGGGGGIGAGVGGFGRF